MAKRVFDILFSIIAILLLVPIYIIVSIIIFGTNGFPIIYKQVRIGLNSCEFKIYKFRTMVNNADSMGSYFTSTNDTRVTPVGKFLRKTSIDELPQFFNVLFGHMSIVGPRPNVPAQIELYSTQDWKLRNSVKPGITGLAQVSGRSGCSFDERLKYDLEYVQNHSFIVDMSIILRTVVGVVTGKGVN